MRYLTFALGKGRLAKTALDLFEKIGITCEEMKDKDSRKLIFVNEELKLKFFLAKGPDVPTYVEYGAADIGIVGEDTIMEEQRKLYEVLDLGFGKCRMCVCGPASAKELLLHQEQIRVATKYPRIIFIIKSIRQWKSLNLTAPLNWLPLSASPKLSLTS
jgi:ATP phosphoribosyltransferase